MHHRQTDFPDEQSEKSKLIIEYKNYNQFL